MGLHDFLTWIIGIGCLLYFLVAIVKPEWFLYIPPEQRESQAEQIRLLSPDKGFSEREEGGDGNAVTEQVLALGVTHLKDIVKGGIKERFAHLRKMGIKTVLIDRLLVALGLA